MNDKFIAESYLRKIYGIDLTDIETMLRKSTDRQALKISEVASILDLSERTVIRMITDGLLIGYRVGTGNKSLRVTSRSLDDYQSAMIQIYQESEGILPAFGQNMTDHDT